MTTRIAVLTDAVAWLFVPKATIMGLGIGFVCGWWSRRAEVADAAQLRDENKRLRDWQGAQAKTPVLGAYRAPPAVLAYVNAGPPADGSCEHCGCHWMQSCDCHNKPKPTPRPPEPSRYLE